MQDDEGLWHRAPIPTALITDPDKPSPGQSADLFVLDDTRQAGAVQGEPARLTHAPG